MNAKLTPVVSTGNACTPSAGGPPIVRRRQRRHVWEIPAMFHCSVLGTCLSLGELHGIARRAGHAGAHGASAYEVHVLFVKALATCNAVSRLVDKALEKRHASAGRPFKQAQSELELEAIWKEAIEGGDIAGGYWVAMSHPLASEALQWRLFGEVHMLSHLLGASRRSDLGRLHKLELCCTEFEAELGLVKQQHRTVRKQRDKLALDLTEKERETDRLERRLVLAQDRALALRVRDGVDVLEARVAELEAELGRTREEASVAAVRIKDGRLELEAALAVSAATSERLHHLREENEAVEAELRENVEGAAEWGRVSGSGASSEPQRRLDGRRILYVGGRSHLVPYYRVLVERRGAEFSHHDGGVEESLDAVTRGLSTVDAVVCPMDCVSHAACLKVKQACKRLGKQFIPLRSSGLSSFARGIRSVA